MRRNRNYYAYRQHDTADCGPTCLKMIAKFYGKDYSLQDLRERCNIARGGVSLLGISDAAESLGFRTTGVRIEWNLLRKEASYPCIVHWDQNHFVVVYAINKKDEVIVADPAIGLIKYSKPEFLKRWVQTNNTGIALLLEPKPSFYIVNEGVGHKSGLAIVFRYLYPYRAYIIQIFLAMITASIISLLLPFITQAVVDIGIGAGNVSFVAMMLIAQFMLILGGLANNFIRGWLMLHTTTRVSISLISDFLCKLMNLPLAFFDKRQTGDIMQRISDYNRIQSFLTGSLLSMVIAVVSMVIYVIIMAGYSTKVFLTFIVCSSIYIAWVMIFMKRRKKLDYMRFQQASTNQSNIVQLVSGMQDIKLNGCERQKRWEWERIQASLFKINIKSLSLGQYQEGGSVLIDQFKNLLISFVAAKSVIDGNMTFGMMMALQYILGQMNAPIAQFVGFMQSAQDAMISIDRLGEIHDMRDETPKDEYRIDEIPYNANIVFQNVDYQYDCQGTSKVLDNISVSIPSGKVTAIVGASGSGKSTMIKMMLGFYQPKSGRILLGTTPLRNYNERCWRKVCGSVMQEGYIFSDTIAANISISDEYPDMDKVRQSAAVSRIDDWVDELPLGYNTKIGNEGQGLSTGQKQRLLIARAVYKEAKYLFLDEATNALDAKNEKNIMENLNSLFHGKTVVVVAHRLSTVKKADNIIVLDKGKIVEEGTHAQLTMIKGKYYELVKNQFEIDNCNNG